MSILQRSWNQILSQSTAQSNNSQQSSEQSSLRFSNPTSSKGTGAFNLRYSNPTSNTGVGKFDLRFNNFTSNNRVGNFGSGGSNSGVGNKQDPPQGGNIDTQGILNMAQGAVDIIGGGINDFKISDYNPIQYGQYNSLESLDANSGNTQQLNLEGNNVAGGAVSGALSGASAGAMFGPWGMAIGGVVGGVSRLLTGIFGNDKKKKEEEKRYKDAFGGLVAQAQNITTSEINRNIWNDFKNGGLINNVFESGGFMGNSSGNKGNKYSAYPGMIAGALVPDTPAPLEESNKGYEDMSLEDLARKRRFLLESSYDESNASKSMDASERITLSKGNNKSAKFINQNKISKDAIHQIDSLSKEYNLDPHELLASLLIENSGYTDITTHAYYNTHNLNTKRFEKNRISTDPFLIFPDRDEDAPISPVYDFPTDYTKMAKELGILQKDGSYNEDALKDRLRKNIEAIENVKKQNKRPISGIDAHALYLKEFGYDAVNPKQQVIPGVKNDYVTMIKDGAEGIRREYPDMFKNRGQREESANSYKNGGMISNVFESGGQMSNGGVFSNNVNIVNSGGTHEENKYGGIPVSVDQEGKPNLIEEGEVVWNDYVFSNSLNLEEDLRKGSNLPKGYTGKSFARIAEDIQKESEERPYNPISRRGLEDGLGKLIIAQELEKLRQDEDNLLQLMGEDANVFVTGGDMNSSTSQTIFNTSFNPQHYSNKFQGMKQQSTKASAEESTNSAIDDFIALLDANLSEDDPIKELYLSYIEAGIDNVDMVKMLVGQDILESGGKPYNNNWGNITAGSNYKGKKVRRGDRDAEGNPIEQDFRTYDSTKDYVKDKISLLERLYDFDKNDPAEVFAGKLTGSNKGGYKYATDPEYANKLARMWGGDTSVRSGSYTGQSASSSGNTSVASNRTFSPERITGISGLPPTTTRYSTNGQSADASAQKGEEDLEDPENSEEENSEEENSEEENLLGFTNLLSLAPIIGNMAGYAESLFKKPEITQFDRVSPTPVNERLNYTPVNSAYASDILQNQYAGTRRSIMDSTGGNRGVAQTALLTNDRNMAEALYGAAYQGEQINFTRNAQVQGFNAGVSQFNSQQDLQSQMANARMDMEETIANEQNRAALENDRQIRRNTVLENLGGLAQQIRWEKLAPIISGGYDQYGRKVKTDSKNK